MPRNKRLEWSPRAARDVLAIEEFYGNYSQITADRVVAEIRRTAARLERFPYLGRTGQVPRTRELVILKYPFALVYRIIGDRVRIGRVLHQHQNIRSKVAALLRVLSHSTSRHTAFPRVIAT